MDFDKCKLFGLCYLILGNQLCLEGVLTPLNLFHILLIYVSDKIHIISETIVIIIQMI